jgi:tetratricopeptide (TPR) repeat protein
LKRRKTVSNTAQAPYSATPHSQPVQNGWVQFLITASSSRHNFKMKIKLGFLILLLWCQGLASFGQKACSFSPEYVNMQFCLTGYSSYTDNINASILVDNILDKVNIKNRHFITKTCRGINNAVALKYNGLNYILLDVDWMENLKYGKKDWFHLFVIGHEMAHHLLKHTDKKAITVQESIKDELASDEFGGYLLGIYGASLSDVNSLLVNFPNDEIKNSTHPKKTDRESAVKKGYNISKSNEINLLLQSLTYESNFNLRNLPYILSLARSNLDIYLKTADKGSLSKAIDYYQQAIRFSSDPQIAYELGALFLSRGDREKYNIALELAYKKTRDEKFILELFNSLITSSDENTDKLLLKYKGVINSINDQTFYEPICLQGIAKYYGYMARKNYNDKGIDFNQVANAELFLNNALLKNYKDESLSTVNSKAEIYNMLGLCALMREDYGSAENYFTKAKSNFEYTKKFDHQLENLFSYYSLNLLAINYNIALSSVRLRDWQNGLNSLNEYTSLLNGLSEAKKAYIKAMRPDAFSEHFYLQGRCLHGLGRYYEAITAFSNALKFENNSWYLYFYRGISYLGINNVPQACKDFNIACKNGINDACNRLNTTCN